MGRRKRQRGRRDFGSLHDRPNGRILARYRHDGKATTRTFRGPNAERLADEWLAVARARLIRGEPVRPTRGVGLKDYILQVRGRFEARVAPSTWRSYKCHLERAGQHFGNRAMRAIDYDEADAFLHKIGKKNSAATVHRYRATLSKLFKWALREGHVRVNPFRGLELERPETPHHEYLSPDEVAKRIGVLDEGSEMRLFAELAYETGLRRGENAVLELCDIPQEGPPRVIVRRSKSHEGRVVPLTVSDGVTRGGVAVVADVLALPRPEGQARVWSYSADYFCREYGKAMDAAEISDRLHELRHACASRLALREPLHVVQKWMGHKSLLTTRKYAHAPQEALFEAAARIGQSRNSGSASG